MKHGKIHYPGPGTWTACGQNNSNVQTSMDPARVTCRACKRAAHIPAAGQNLPALELGKDGGKS